MTVTQLASESDVVDAMGRDLTPTERARVDSILNKASEMFRRRSLQTFTPGTSTVRLRVTAGKVYLPERPLVSVTSVVDDAGVPVAYTLNDQWLTIAADSTSANSYSFVTVSYAHGGDVPDLVRLCIADLARTALLVPVSAVAGSVSHTETRGPFTVTDTYAGWAQGGGVRLSPDDLALADSYRIRAPRIYVVTP